MAKKSKPPGKRKPISRKPPKMRVYSAAEGDAAGPESSGAMSEEQVYASNLSLHDLFQQQTTKMLDRADLSEEQKQSLLIGISCPCCGAGGFSFTAKLRR